MPCFSALLGMQPQFNPRCVPDSRSSVQYWMDKSFVALGSVNQVNRALISDIVHEHCKRFYVLGYPISVRVRMLDFDNGEVVHMTWTMDKEVVALARNTQLFRKNCERAYQPRRLACMA